MSTPKVIGLNGFGLEVPELDVAEKFYTAFGLALERRGGMLGLRSPGRPRDEIVVVRGARKRLHHLSFLIRAGDEAPFADRLRRADLAVSDAPDGVRRDGLWFQDPWGTWINLCPGEQSAAAPPKAATARLDVHLWRELDRDPKPARIGHMLVFTGEWERSEAFFTEVLGLRTSDRAAGKVAFMAAGDGVVDHHCFGLINSTHRGYQHASFQVSGLDDIGFGTWRMREAGYRESFGPGRHALASNLFHYVRDPWGSWIEYYADMDKISPSWTCRDWNELPYVWGPEWSPEFWGEEMNGNFEPR